MLCWSFSLLPVRQISLIHIFLFLWRGRVLSILSFPLVLALLDIPIKPPTLHSQLPHLIFHTHTHIYIVLSFFPSSVTISLDLEFDNILVFQVLLLSLIFVSFHCTSSWLLISDPPTFAPLFPMLVLTMTFLEIYNLFCLSLACA